MKILIKIGGTLVDDADQRRALADQIAYAHQAGHSVVLVHGGGRQLTRFLEERGIPSHFVNGLRVTTTETMDAVLKVLAGSVNKQLTAALRAAGVNAVGLSGIDGRLTTAVRLSAELGWVGRVTSVDASLLELLTSAGRLPVIACVAGDDLGQAWNINADQMAVACAHAFGAAQLIFLTDVAGVMDGNGSVLPLLDAAASRALIENGIARGGMQAKLEAACAAIAAGVERVVIAPGSGAGLLARLLAGEAAGTEIRATTVKDAAR